MKAKQKTKKKIKKIIILQKHKTKLLKTKIKL